MKRSILATFAMLLFQACIIYGVLVYLPWVPMRVKVLDIIVFSIILWMYGYDLFYPIVNLNEKNPPEVGTLGVRWTGQFIYTFVAIGIAVYGICYYAPFKLQLLGQVLIFALLLLFFFGAANTFVMVKKVAKHEEAMLSGRQQMRTAFRQVMDELAINPDISQHVSNSLKDIEEKLKYISPSDNSEAINYENQFVNLANKILLEMSDFKLNEENIRQDIAHMQRVLENRKNIRN